MLVLLVFLLALSSVLGGITDPAAFCARRSRVPIHDLTRIMKHQLPETTEGTCYMECMLDSAGAIDEDGNILPEELIRRGRTTRSLFDTDNILSKVIVDCGRVANFEDVDDCSRTFTFLSCNLERAGNGEFLSKKLPELNITLPPLTFVLAFLSLL